MSAILESAAPGATAGSGAPLGLAADEATRLDDLLAPIPGDDPAGRSLRYDVIHDEIRELRRADDPTLPQGVWQHELKRADWRGVARLASEALRTRSKDLQMAVWLVEAWARLDGLRGLARGVELVAGLVETYGDTLHPRPDEDDGGPAPDAASDPALRVAALGRLEQALPDALLRLRLTRPRGDDGEVCTWADWKRALYLENLAAKNPEAAAEAGGVTRERFLASVGLTPDGLYRPLAAEADACGASIARLAALLDQRYGRDAPAFGAVREELEAISRLARKLATERGEDDGPGAAAEAGAAEPSESADPADEPSGEAADSDSGAAPREAGAGRDRPCRITTRAEAYRALEQAAELLLRVEPHSPVPYLVKRAVRWGGLSLSELYQELFEVADPNVVFKLLGIQRNAEE